MKFNRQFLLPCIILIITLVATYPLAAEEGKETELSSGENGPTAIILVPLTGKDVPSYIPMIADRLFASKMDKTQAYSIFNQEDFSSILNEEEIQLPKIITEDIALQIGKRLKMDQVLFGVITKENDDFVIKTRIMDVEKGEIISRGSEKAGNIKALEEAVGKLTRDIVKTVLPEEAVAEAVELLDTAEQASEEEDIQESITTFEKLAEEDPDKALELVAEPVREAIKETVREEIVDEEIQVLFDKEKADKKRVWQFWSIVGLESSVQIGNLLGLFSVDMRLDSVLYWNNYMNNILMDDPYRSYIDNLKNSQTHQGWNYFLTGGANFWLAYYYNTIPDDLFSFSKFGRNTLAISNFLNISGYIAQTASSQLGFYAQRKYFDYMNATTDFTKKYEAYREAYLFPLITEYSRTGLWAIGITGILTAAILPGEKTPMILSEKSRKYLVLGQNLLSIGNLTSGMATNFRGVAEEAWVSDNSPSGGVGESNYDFNYITSEVLYYSTYAIYLGAAIYTYLGLTYNGTDSEIPNNEDTGMSNLSFSILPAPGGVTAFARVRLD